MIIKTRDGGCIAAGPATRKGGELTYVGAKQIPKYSFSIRTKNEKDESGEWRSEFLSCEFFGESAKSAPTINGGDMVLAAGTIETRTYTGRDGEERTAVTLRCEYASVSAGGELGYSGDPMQPAFDELEDDGELPF